MKEVGQIGDVNPIEYRGGLIFEDDEGNHTLEYINYSLDEMPHVLDLQLLSENDEWKDGVTVTVFQIPIEDPEDFFDWYDWVDWEKIESFTGQEQLRQTDISRPVFRAQLIEDVGSYYGFENLDESPIRLSVRELEGRWGYEV